MIFVTVGTQRWPFERLVAAADRLAATGEAVVVQCGTSRVPAQHATCIDFLPFTDFDEHIRSARVVVAHAGIGSVATCLRHGHTSVVVPRLEAFGEAIDDHQLSFARRLAELELITLVEDVGKLGDAVAAPRATVPKTGLSSALRQELVAYISRYALPVPELARPTAQ